MPLALLLFLICAMTASIVLAAGTVAAGRASNLAESDQAYYSVTSAVNLFRDELAGANGQGHEVTVAVEASVADGSATGYRVLVTTDGKVATANYSLLERAAMRLLFGNDASSNDAAQTVARTYFATSGAWDNWPALDNLSTGKFATFALNHTSSSLDEAQARSLDLTVEANIDSEGGLVFAFMKQADDNSGDYLSIFNLTCDADLESGSLESADATASTEVKYATITWVPSNVERG